VLKAWFPEQLHKGGGKTDRERKNATKKLCTLEGEVKTSREEKEPLKKGLPFHIGEREGEKVRAVVLRNGTWGRQGRKSP